MNNFLTYRISVIIFFLLLFFNPSFSQTIPGIPPDNEYLLQGYIDVTLLGADPTGKQNSTEAIRKAVVMSRDYSLVCYIPSGTYLVSDTIRVMRKCLPGPNTYRTDNKQAAIVGDPINRPLIKLEKGAPNFQDEENPMPVFWIYSMSAWGQQPECEGSTDPLCEQSNINFNQIIKGIDIDLQQNPGAVGVRHAGAQGSTIEDMKINATGAFAGLYNPPGQAGGTYNVEITGGKYGVYLKKVGRRQQGKFIIITGCTFKNQEIGVVNIDLTHPLIMVGFHIIKEKGPINSGLPEIGLTMIDGLVELGSGPVITGTQSSLYMQNVYVKGASKINDTYPLKSSASLQWIKEFNYCEPAAGTNLINGVFNKNTSADIEEVTNTRTSELAAKLLKKHIWNEDRFPGKDGYGVVNIKDPAKMNGFQAVGDGVADDTRAFEYAISNFDKIFLPKGTYLVNQTIILRANTLLFGSGRALTSITSGSEWVSGDDAPIMSTVDDPMATTTLADLSVRARGKHLEWRAGQGSMVRSITAGNVVITGNGGGRWYALMCVGSQLKILGTKENLYMYANNPERSKDPQWEITNARNVRLFYLKTEAGTDGHNAMTSLRIRNSENIGVYGSTGNVDLTTSPELAMIEVIDSENIIISHVQPFLHTQNWNSFSETRGDKKESIDLSVKLALFKRGAFLVEPVHLSHQDKYFRDFTQTKYPN